MSDESKIHHMWADIDALLAAKDAKIADLKAQLEELRSASAAGGVLMSRRQFDEQQRRCSEANKTLDDAACLAFELQRDVLRLTAQLATVEPVVEWLTNLSPGEWRQLSAWANDEGRIHYSADGHAPRRSGSMIGGTTPAAACAAALERMKK